MICYDLLTYTCNAIDNIDNVVSLSEVYLDIFFKAKESFVLETINIKRMTDTLSMYTFLLLSLCIFS